MKKVFKLFTILCMAIFCSLMLQSMTSLAASATIVSGPKSSYSYNEQSDTIRVRFVDSDCKVELTGYPGMVTITNTKLVSTSNNVKEYDVSFKITANPVYTQSASNRSGIIKFMSNTGALLCIAEIKQQNHVGTDPGAVPKTYFNVISSPFVNGTTSVASNANSLLFICESNEALTANYRNSQINPTSLAKDGKGGIRYTYIINIPKNTSPDDKYYSFTISAGNKQYYYTIKQGSLLQNVQLQWVSYHNYGYARYSANGRGLRQGETLLMKGYEKGRVIGLRFQTINTSDAVILEVYENDGNYVVRKAGDLGSINGLDGVRCNKVNDLYCPIKNENIPFMPKDIWIPSNPDEVTSYFKTTNSDHTIYYVMQSDEYNEVKGTLKYSTKTGLYTTKSNYKIHAPKLFEHDFTRKLEPKSAPFVDYIEFGLTFNF